MELDQEEEQPLEKGACSADEEGGSCYGKEKKFSEVLGERTNRKGVWLVSLDVKEMELLEEASFCSWCWLIPEGRSLHLGQVWVLRVGGFCV